MSILDNKIPKKISYFPIILGLYPIISLVTSNLERVPVYTQLGSIILPGVGIGMTWVVLRRIIKNTHKADLIGALIGFAFFSYGHLIRAISILMISLKGNSFDVLERFGRLTDHPDVLQKIFVGWFIFLILAVFLLLKTRINLQPVSQFLNYFAFAMVVLLLVNLATTLFNQRSSTQYSSEWDKQVQQENLQYLKCPENPPDIYYIIPDAYARADVLANIYGVDNTKFINFLTNQGFTVLEDSRSNYSQTTLSLASTLNFSYLDDLQTRLGELSQNRGPLQEMILNNKLTLLLHVCGYKIIAINSGFSPTEMQQADIYLRPKVTLSDFENELVNLSPLPTISIVFKFINQYQIHRDRITFTLDQLPLLGSQYSEPIFVFAHLTIPHHPFVFDAQGNGLDSGRLFALSEDYKGEGLQEYMQGYTGQLSYLNTRLEQIIPRIIAHQPASTIVLIQSDHGPSSHLDWDHPTEIGIHERMSILSAYYLGNQDQVKIPANLTPVNSFRFILNLYFNASLPLLDDQSYFSSLNLPYQFHLETPTAGP